MKTLIMILLAAFTAMPASFVTSADLAAEPASRTDRKPAKKKAEVKEVTFRVHLHCENCVKKVQENIAFEKGVKDLKVSLDDQTVYVKYDAAKTSEEKLKAAIEKLGYPVEGKVLPGEEHHHNHEGHHHHNHN